ncbi:MAG: hypothetical protein IJ630_01130 [Treponema sp.]|nr:hypothetical protein [Treponema sp.]
MKKILAFVLAATFSLPTFAFGIKVGDSFSYIPTKDGKNFVSVVTKIAPTASGTYELVLLSNGISYSYAVAEGETITFYGKTTPKAKNVSEINLKVASVKNNEIELESASADSIIDEK